MLVVLIGVLVVMFVLAAVISERRAGQRPWDGGWWSSSVWPYADGRADSDAGSSFGGGGGFDGGGGGADGGGGC